ncbi:MAG: hypothetical protein R2747_13025 [Pyrinomonadaceae bacterium]
MKVFGKMILASICFALGASGVFAQEMEKTAAKETARAAAMKKLDFLIGDWEGSGWIIIGRERKNFTVRESLQTKLDGQIIVVEGIGKTVDEKTGAEKIVHNAYGVFSYDDESGKIRFRYFKENGQAGEVTPEFFDKKVVWGFDVPENKVTVRFTEKTNEKGNWQEIGEVSRDGGKTWFQFFEMELSRVKQ